MPTMLDLQCHAILTAATSAELGIVVTTDDPIRARASLYKFRSSFPDPSFAEVQIRVSPNDSEREIWLIKKEAVAPTVNLVPSNVSDLL